MEGVEGIKDGKVFFDGTTWRATCNNSPGVPISHELAYSIRKGLYANAWFDATSPRFRKLSDSDRAYREYYSYNCHRTALSIQGNFYKDASSDPSVLIYQAAYDFKPAVYKDIEKNKTQGIAMEGLPSELSKVTPPCVVHLEKDFMQEVHPVHSFVYLGTDATGEHVCFEKAGYRDGKFRVTSYKRIEAMYPPRAHVAYVQPPMTGHTAL